MIIKHAWKPAREDPSTRDEMSRDHEHRVAGGSVPGPKALCLALLVFFSLLVVPRLGFGADEQEETRAQAGNGKAFQLGEVVVTEKRSTASEVSTVTEVTREDFRLRGANTVADALRTVPGAKVSFSRGSLAGNGKNEDLIRLRGFETTDVLILIDGMPLTEPYMRRVDLSQITLDNVAKIKVIKGPSSVLYGPNTTGGIVNIVTEKGEGFRSRVDQRFGDYKSFRTLAQNMGACGPVDYVIGGSYDRSDGFPISRDFPGSSRQPGTLRVNSDYSRYNLTGRISSDIGSRGRVSVGGSYYDFSGGVPFGMNEVAPDLWRKDWNRWYVNGFAEWNFTDALGVKGQVFYNNFRNKIKTYTSTTFEQIVSDGTGISTHDNDVYGYFLNPRWDLGPASNLRAGIRYERNNVDIQKLLGEPWDRYASETYTFSLEDEVRPLNGLSLVAGVGYNYHRKIEAFAFDGESQQYLNPGKDVDSVDFQVGLAYRPCEWVKLHASAARKTSFPNMRQLYSTDGGNPDLKTQTAMLYEVGVDATYRDGYPGASLALFRSDVEDLIVKKEYEIRNEDGDLVESGYRYENVNEALLQGVELSLYWYPLEELGLFANYTLLLSEDKQTGNELDFRPPHVVNLEARYQASFGLTAAILYGYTSTQEYEPKFNPGEVEELPASGTWEIHLAQKLPFQRSPDRYVEVYVDVENLLDEYYEEDPRKAAPGRRVWAGIRASF